MAEGIILMIDPTGHYVVDDRPTEPPCNEIPEEAYHDLCEGMGCEGCGGTGVDPAKEAEYIAAAKAEARAYYEGWLEGVEFAKREEADKREEWLAAIELRIPCSICGVPANIHDDDKCREEYED
jgi:hypothetical protein